MFPKGVTRYTYALMRIVFGAMFLTFGLQKLGLIGGHHVVFLSESGVAAILETVGGAMIAIGFFAAPAAFICSGEMAVAYFQAHQPHGLLPIQNGGMSSVLFCFAFLYIAAEGSGALSVDKLRR